MTHRFAISVDWDDYGRLVGSVPSLDDCMATGRGMEELLENLEEEVRLRLASQGKLGDLDIELVGYDIWTI